jgi:DNA-binding winged helix-turn-helix (wHTH) protein
MLGEVQANCPILVIYKGVLAGTRWPVSSESLTLGRAEDCDVVLPERQISRYHARIERDATGYLLRDLGSRNGTAVNGEPIRGLPYRLRDGDEIQLAGVLQLGFVGGDATLPLAGLGEFDLPISGDLTVNAAARQVSLGREILDPPLSPAQFALLTALVEAGSNVVTREEAVAIVWPDATGGVTDQALDALVYRLRERLSELDLDHNYIVTVRGHGFRFARRAARKPRFA